MKNIVIALAAGFSAYVVMVALVKIFRVRKDKMYKLKRYINMLTFLAFIDTIVLISDNLLGKYMNMFLAATNIAAAFSVIKLIDSIINDGTIFFRNGEKPPKLVRSLYIFIIMLIVVIGVMKINLGVNLTAIVTTSAVLSMVIGLALQDTLTNLIAGVVLHSEKSIKIGDFVKVNDIEGIVIEMSWRATKIQSILTGGVIFIPNSIVVKQSTINYNQSKLHLIKVAIRASYEETPNNVAEVLLGVARENQEILKEPAAEVRVISYGESSINYELRVWSDKYDRKKIIESDIYKNIWYAFHRNGIKIPFPVREIHNFSENKNYIDINREKEEIFKKIEFFKDLTEQEMKELFPRTKSKVYGKNEKIFTEGDEGDSFFVIYKGKVNIIINNEKIATLKKGEFFGEMSLFTGKQRSATAIAEEDVELLVLDKAGFSEIIMNNENIIHKISEAISKREFENEMRNRRQSEINREKDDILIKKKQNSMMEKIKKFFEL